MIIKNVHITWNLLKDDNYLSSQGDVEIEGIGQLTIRNFLSGETRNLVKKELEDAARNKIDLAMQDIKGAKE